jgi:hypothetical protein
MTYYVVNGLVFIYRDDAVSYKEASQKEHRGK